MKYKAETPEEYLKSLPNERRNVIDKLRETVSENLPEGFSETISYGMLGYVVPHSAYPDGYHCNPDEPLPFISIASQKNHIAFYHMGLYADDKLMDWFIKKYSEISKHKPDMGKSCIRFNKLDQIPYKLIGELCGKITPEEWINYYGSEIRK
ncbi:MAG: DUF1801 domain-containing protein [Melioribacteraceae bacterium]|nr:DUF1801 domain-containing protein [Melioribacteraceae bacterium]